MDVTSAHTIDQERPDRPIRGSSEARTGGTACGSDQKTLAWEGRPLSSRQPLGSSAISTNRVVSVAKEMPARAAAMGINECEVKPGRVLISMIHNFRS